MEDWMPGIAEPRSRRPPQARPQPWKPLEVPPDLTRAGCSWAPRGSITTTGPAPSIRPRSRAGMVPLLPDVLLLPGDQPYLPARAGSGPFRRAGAAQPGLHALLGDGPPGRVPQGHLGRGGGPLPDAQACGRRGAAGGVGPLPFLPHPARSPPGAEPPRASTTCSPRLPPPWRRGWTCTSSSATAPGTRSRCCGPCRTPASASATRISRPCCPAPFPCGPMPPPPRAISATAARTRRPGTPEAVAVRRTGAFDGRYDYLYSLEEVEERITGQFALLRKTGEVAVVFRNHVRGAVGPERGAEPVPGGAEAGRRRRLKCTSASRARLIAAHSSGQLALEEEADRFHQGVGFGAQEDPALVPPLLHLLLDDDGHRSGFQSGGWGSGIRGAPSRLHYTEKSEEYGWPGRRESRVRGSSGPGSFRLGLAGGSVPGGRVLEDSLALICPVRKPTCRFWCSSSAKISS